MAYDYHGSVVSYRVMFLSVLVGWAGFEPATFCTSSTCQPRNINWVEFREWAFKKYVKSYAPTVYCYAKKYAYGLSGNLRDLDVLTDSVRNQTIKSLICLSKFLGVHREFKRRLQNYGIKVKRFDALSSFVRIFSNNNSDILDWYRKAVDVVRSNEKVFLKFALITGLRTSEAIDSFNLIIEFFRRSSLSTYFNEERNTLEHFKFKEVFIRRTKNAFVSIVPKSLIYEIANLSPLTYSQIVKRLSRKGLQCRINELRDFYGSFMIRHGLIREEQDLLCDRISASIFIRHYWSPSFKELRDRTLKAIEQLSRLC